MAQARRLCPQAVALSPRFDRYQAYSKQLHQVFNRLTPLVEGIALDEAFLDITGSTALFGPPAHIAGRVREEVQLELGLACSVGAGPNKLVAKLASKEAKPRASRHGVVPGAGSVIVPEEDVLGFLWPMPVGALWGVGRAAQERLARLGVTTVGALAALPRGPVVSALGKAAGELVYELAWGRDTRPVVPDRPVKSIGHEETYPVDVVDRQELERRLVVMADSVAARVRQHGSLARTVTLKLRYDDFATITRSHTFASPQLSGPALWEACRSMLDGVDLRQGVRLLGVTASGLVTADQAPGEQLRLGLSEGPGEDEAWGRASRAVDAVRRRFGEGAVAPAATLGAPARPRWPSGPSGHG
jgi:DNA polymerase-4